MIEKLRMRASSMASDEATSGVPPGSGARLGWWSRPVILSRPCSKGRIRGEHQEPEKAESDQRQVRGAQQGGAQRAEDPHQERVDRWLRRRPGVVPPGAEE